MRLSMLLPLFLGCMVVGSGGAPAPPPPPPAPSSDFDERLANSHINRWVSHTTQMSDKCFNSGSKVMGGMTIPPISCDWYGRVNQIMAARNYTKVQAVASLYSDRVEDHNREFLIRITFQGMQGTANRKLQRKIAKVYNDAGGGPRGEEKAVRKLITGKWRKKFRISDSMNFSQMYYAVTPLGNALALSNSDNISIADFHTGNPSSGTMPPLGMALYILEDPKRAVGCIQDALASFFNPAATKDDAWIHDDAVASLPRLVDLLKDVPTWKWLHWFDGDLDACLRDLTVHKLSIHDIKFRYCGKEFPLSILFNGVNLSGSEWPETPYGDGTARQQWQCKSCGSRHNRAGEQCAACKSRKEAHWYLPNALAT